jgi:hypothetical protein
MHVEAVKIWRWREEEATTFNKSLTTERSSPNPWYRTHFQGINQWLVHPKGRTMQVWGSIKVVVMLIRAEVEATNARNKSRLPFWYLLLGQVVLITSSGGDILIVASEAEQSCTASPSSYRRWSFCLKIYFLFVEDMSSSLIVCISCSEFISTLLLSANGFLEMIISQYSLWAWLGSLTFHFAFVRAAEQKNFDGWGPIYQKQVNFVLAHNIRTNYP